MITKKGHRVKSTAHYAGICPRSLKGRPHLAGSVVRVSRTNECVVVLWDGLKTEQYLHSSFIELLGETK